MKQQLLDPFLQAFLDHSFDIIISLDLQYCITEFNLKAEDYHDWCKEEVIGKNFLKLYETYHFPLWFSLQDPKILTKEPHKIVENTININGSERIAIWKIIPIKDKTGTLVSLMLIGKDITEEKATETKSKQAQYYLENVVECTPGSIYWKDKNGVYLGANDFFKKIIGVKEVVGKTDHEMHGSAETELLLDHDKQVMETGQPIVIEEPVTLLTGEQKTFIAAKMPLKNANGQIIGIVGNSIDITELKLIQSALQKEKQRAELANQAKSNFLAVMSHELRTPLNAIMGMAQILKLKNLPQEQDDYVEIIQQSGTNLLALINDVLDFSKLEANKIAVVSEVFNFYKLIEEVKNSFLHQAENKQIKLIIDYPEDVPHWVIKDPLRIRQIVLNLLGNAIKFTDRGYVKISVLCQSKLKNKAELKVLIEDTGIGIPADKLNLIFDRFSQVETNYSRRFGGVGLGLAICKQLVEIMDGYIGVKSELNKGSLFWFSLPFLLPQNETGFALKKPYANNETQTHFNCRLLLVEDNQLNQKVAKIMLEGLGCQLDIAENGKNGLSFFENNKYDLIFMDIGLPDLDGLNVIRTIRQNNQGKHVPIIAMTAHVLEEDRENCYMAGANDILTKPVVREELITILKTWINTEKILRDN